MARSLRTVGVCLRLVEATRNWKAGRWQLPSGKQMSLVGENVLIIDAAAGHGRTIDQMAVLASRFGAKQVGAAVLLSRLTPPCEEAFHLRLSGGFHRLYNLPIRPVAIRGSRMNLCPVCRRKKALRRFAEEADVEALEHWAEGLLKTRRSTPEQAQRPRDRQLTLFEVEKPFLSACGAAVASGVTLHALGAASTNGCAPLTLPELFDERIPWRSRATMVENLPSGVFEWTGGTLVSDLTEFLSMGVYPSIWKATANVLSREGNAAWLEHLDSLLSRLRENKHRTSESFWNFMACNAYLLAAGNSEFRSELQDRVEQLLTTHEDDVVRKGLQQMQEVICE
ncbi:MAG: hypothetical protein ACYTG0_21945 [Planctomycetota bacterium]|jgi:hypothetical protein